MLRTWESTLFIYKVKIKQFLLTFTPEISSLKIEPGVKLWSKVWCCLETDGGFIVSC